MRKWTIISITFQQHLITVTLYQTLYFILLKHNVKLYIVHLKLYNYEIRV